MSPDANYPGRAAREAFWQRIREEKHSAPHPYLRPETVDEKRQRLLVALQEHESAAKRLKAEIDAISPLKGTLMTITYNRPFATRPEAERFVEEEKRRYHPCGYGTTLDVVTRAEGFAVTGYRYSSCD